MYEMTWMKWINERNGWNGKFNAGIHALVKAKLIILGRHIKESCEMKVIITMSFTQITWNETAAVCENLK